MVSLIRCKENLAEIKSQVGPYMEEIAEMKEGKTSVIQINGRPITVLYEIEMSIVDGNMKGLLQGNTGSPRHYCHFRSKEYNNLESIEAGFKIDKTYAVYLEHYKSNLNPKKRLGQLHQPILITDFRFFALTHTMMRSLDNVLKI